MAGYINLNKEGVNVMNKPCRYHRTNKIEGKVWYNNEVFAMHGCNECLEYIKSLVSKNKVSSLQHVNVWLKNEVIING